MINVAQFDANLQALITTITTDINGLIDDNAASEATTYSATKIDAKFTTVGDVVNHGVSALQTTLAILNTRVNELASGAATPVVDYVGTSPQELTSDQQVQVRANIGALSASDVLAMASLPDTDYVSFYKKLRNIV